mmetsp:Transcript_18854/g.55278  ORF Transcript_18854/g.55278 Transcript_18854/m.55278 type:complete len:200 (+) Transcript_18854:54-653(+)
MPTVYSIRLSPRADSRCHRPRFRARMRETWRGRAWRWWRRGHHRPAETATATSCGGHCREHSPTGPCARGTDRRRWRRPPCRGASLKGREVPRRRGRAASPRGVGRARARQRGLAPLPSDGRASYRLAPPPGRASCARGRGEPQATPRGDQPQGLRAAAEAACAPGCRPPQVSASGAARLGGVPWRPLRRCTPSRRRGT